MSQTDGEDLIGPDRGVPDFAVDDVVEAIGLVVPKQGIEASLSAFGQLTNKYCSAGIVEVQREVLKSAKGVVPERLNLHWFSVARSNHLIAHPRIHPCELNTGNPRF